MTKDYEAAVRQPKLSDWSTVRCQLSDDSLQSLRANARRRLVRTAEAYRDQLVTLGRRSGLCDRLDAALTGDADCRPLVMTGHQPVIFHSGLTFKYETTEQFAAQNEAIAVAVVIDTDEGDAGAFQFPQAAGDGQIATSPISFAREPSLYSVSRRKPAPLLAAESLRVATGLKACQCEAAAATFSDFAEKFAAIQTDSMVEANLITRWDAGIGGRILEIPLSSICGFPETIQFFAQILAKPMDFATCYNSTLDRFRAEQKIKNDANPFPSLNLEQSRWELPFWLVDPAAGTRSVVTFQQTGFERFLESADGVRTEILPGNEAATIFSLIVAGKQLIPRGALITATLRLLFSDLFVHGTGGGRYDRYTDTLIKTWWKVEPTPFAVASASRFLFDTQRGEYAQLQRISEQLRDLQFNPHRHFSSGLFSSEIENVLRVKLEAKEDAVNRLKTARESGVSAQEVGREIQQIGDEIKAMVAAHFEPRLAKLRSFSSESIVAWSSRTWPWMFFA